MLEEGVFFVRVARGVTGGEKPLPYPPPNMLNLILPCMMMPGEMQTGQPLREKARTLYLPIQFDSECIQC